MAKRWPAVDVRGPLAPLSDEDIGLLVAAIDDYSPTAVEERDAGVRMFFATAEARDAARAALRSATRSVEMTCEPIDVSDEDWAERSQQNLPPVTVGRITIVPDRSLLPSPFSLPPSPYSLPPSPYSLSPDAAPIHLVIPPSMAFGTGHHATTRLCLAALQTIDLAGTTVIDVGTGSGLLALTAAALGAARAVGIDNDPDAIAAARENLARNPHVHGVELRHDDLRHLTSAGVDVVVANLTGALIASASASLLAPLRPGGHLVVSGVLAQEFDAVLRALGNGVNIAWASEEDGWIGARLVKK